MSEAQVLEAVRALHDVSTDDEQRTAVSNYLSSFQRSVLSWNVSMNLLSRPGSLDAQLFAAQTLKEKLRGHSWQLSHDSWQPVRSCIVSVLQRPCEPALEIQVSLCLVALIILTSSDDVVSQLRQALPPSRTLLVLKLLAEEVEADVSPYEPAPGVDKVAWWLQARRNVGNMAQAVLPFIAECVDKPDAAAHPSSQQGATEHAVEDMRRLFLQRALACASAWIRLGVLFTLPSASFEGILDFALTTCREGDASLVPCACETLAETFERCPDPLLAHLQPHLLDLSTLALNPPDAGNAQWQQAVITLFVVYVQSCADSIVRGGRSDLLHALFAVAHATKQVTGAAVPPEHDHEFAAVHVVEAAAMVGRALLKAVEDEGEMATGRRGAGVSAQMQGMMQTYLEGVVGLVPLHQAELEAGADEERSAQGTELMREVYMLCAQLVGSSMFASAVAARSTAEAGQSTLAAVLGALVAVLLGGDADGDGDEADDMAVSMNGADSSGVQLTAGLLEVVQRCAAQAQSSDAGSATHSAALAAMFEAMPAIAPRLHGATRDGFTPTLLQIAACAQQVLRREAQRRGDARAGPFVDARLAASAARHDAGRGSSMDTGGMQSTASHAHRPTADTERGEICGRASTAVVHVLRAMRGTPSEVQTANDVLALLQHVPLPAACDSALLSAVFTASAQASAAGMTGDASREALGAVAGQLTTQVAADVKRAAAAAAEAVSAAGLHKPADGGDMHGDGDGLVPAADGGMHEVALAEAFEELTQRVRRAAALLQASRTDGARQGDEEGRGGRVGGPVASAARMLVVRLVEAVPAVAAVLSAASAVRPACASQLRQEWGRVIAEAVSLDAAAAAGLASTVFDVIAEGASVDVLVDWQHALALMIDRYLPREGGHAPTADRVLLTLQKIWALPELQALPCPGEADMVPEASIASSVLCSHVARSALTPASWLSMESVVPLVEAGTARCAMAASANLKHVASAALSALLSMLSASASLPTSSLSPLAGCVLRGGGTMMMGFACALTAPGASHRVLKLTQLLLQLTAVVARAVPLIAAPPLVSLPQMPLLPLPSAARFPAPPTIHPRTLTPATVASGVSYVMLWLKHALACLRPGMLHNQTPDSICSAWQPLLSQAILAGLQAPPATSGPPLGPQPFTHTPGNSMDTNVLPSAPISQPPALIHSASPFVGLPAAAGPFSAHPNVVTWGSLGAGTRFGSALRADIPLAAQLSPHMSSAAVYADQQAAVPCPEAFDMSDALASASCRALKKAIRAVVASLAAPPPPGAPLSDGLSSIPFAPFVSAPVVSAAPAAPQQVFQPALCLTGNAFTAQHAFPAMPLNAGSPVLLPHVLTPAPVHLPLNSHMVHPVAPPPLSSAPIFAASAAPTAFFGPSYSVSAGASSAVPVVPSTALGIPHQSLGMVAAAAPHAQGLAHMQATAASHVPGLAHMQAQALGLSPSMAAAVHGEHGQHAVSAGVQGMPIGSSAGISGVRLPVMGSLEQGMEAVMIGVNPTRPQPVAGAHAKSPGNCSQNRL
eukprot:jgi/Ulvmu1/261/UM001_0265.1